MTDAEWIAKYPATAARIAAEIAGNKRKKRRETPEERGFREAWGDSLGELERLFREGP